MKLNTVIKRPQDCSENMLLKFIDIVTEGGEMSKEQVKGGLAFCERLIFTGNEEGVMGVCALKYPRQSYLQHLFEAAGVPEMMNPHSIEECWVSVAKEYRGKGVWTTNRRAKQLYLANRPYHSVRRANNHMIVNPEKEDEYVQAGHDLVSHVSTDKLKLMIANYDDVFDPKKQLVYARLETISG